MWQNLQKILKSNSKINITKQRYYESEHLALDSSKSKNNLNETHMNAKTALKMSLDWYHFFYKNNGKNIVDFILNK